MASAPAPTPGPRVILAFTAAIVASQVLPVARAIPLLPPFGDPSRSPSSDVLLQVLPVHGAADRIEAIAAALPEGPGILVAHGTEAHLTAAYYLLVMRLWPRQVHFVTCEPTPRIESSRGPVPSVVSWRLHLLPEDADPLRTAGSTVVDPGALCTGTPSP